MRAILFAVVALAAVCAVSGSSCPGVDCQMLGPIYPGSPNWNPLVNKLSAQHKEELFQANLDQLKTLSYESYLQLRKLLVGLEDKYDVYIKLSNALAGGHNARFKMIQGESDKVNILATELGIQVSDDSLYAPGEKPDPNAAAKALQATMAASAAWNKPEPPALIPFPERVNKFVSAQTIATLASSNRQQINQLNPPAIASMTRLIELLEANKNYVRLYGAIKLGHVVDYELINGSRTDLKKTASGLGLEVTDNTISTGGKTDVPPPPVNPQETGGDAQGFDADPLPNNNCGQALCPKRGPNEAEITIVPSVYIPPN